jgi:hypothetical protein
MARLCLTTAAALAFIASSPLLGTTATPAFAQSWGDGGGGEMGAGDVRDFLMDELRTRRSDRREMIRELLAERRGMRDEMMEDDGGLRDRLRGRLRERISERLGEGDEGNCFFITRSLRAEGGDWLALVRRRVCRD